MRSPVSSPALTKTRIALGMLMATATLATAGVAGSLALAHNQTTARDTASSTAGADEQPAPTSRSTHRRPATASPSFAPASKASSTTAPSHTKTKGS